MKIPPINLWNLPWQKVTPRSVKPRPNKWTFANVTERYEEIKKKR